ncbi:MAG: hypothetical protein NT166_30265 [Candidatus Aminicenantes bacterium]|nr:hypothetical protein [Candidatus Aminicenantes bacterium]
MTEFKCDTRGHGNFLYGKKQSDAMRVETHIVGFLDLLGFSAALMSDESRPDHLAGRRFKHEVTVRLAKELIQKRAGSEVKVATLGDSFIVSIPVLSKDKDVIQSALEDVSIGLGIISCLFAAEDYFVRGGIAFGPMVIMDSLSIEPYGAGLIQAVQLEKDAKVPTIVLSRELHNYAYSLKCPENNISMYVFGKGVPYKELPYLDYLVFAEMVNNEVKEHDPRPILACHAERVHEIVLDANINTILKDKADWLLLYHNSHIQKRGNNSDLIVVVQEAKVVEKLFKSAMARISKAASINSMLGAIPTARPYPKTFSFFTLPPIAGGPQRWFHL